MKREGKKEQGPETREEWIERTRQTRPVQGPQPRPKRPPGPLTKEGKFYSKEEYTKEEYLEQVIEPMIEETEFHIKSIDPYGTYVYDDKWGQETFVSGQTLIERYEKEGTLTKLKEHREEVERLPSDARFRKTNQGYEMIPASSLSWTRYYKKRAGELPPVASEISRFGFGAYSAVGSLAKPILDWTGLGKKFDLYSTIGVSSALNPFNMKGTIKDIETGLEKSYWGIHYVSPFDVAFEPLGLSPKGSTQELTGDPFFFAGGIGGEIGIAAGFHYGFKGVGKGIRYGTKAVIRRTPEVYEKFTRIFPEASRRITESGRIITDKPVRPFVSKFGHTKFWYNMGRWASGDIVKVRSIPFYESIPFKEGKVTSRLDIYRGWGQTKWVPTKVLEQAQKAETFHRHFYDPFGRYQVYVTEQVYKPKGFLWWKTAKRQITTFAEHEPLVEKSLIDVSLKEPAFLWSGSKPSMRSGVNIFIEDTRGVMPIHKPVHYRPMFRTGVRHGGGLTGGLPVQLAFSGIYPVSSIGLLSGLSIGSALRSEMELSYDSVLDLSKYQTRDVSRASLQAPMSIQSVFNVTAQKTVQTQKTKLKLGTSLEKTSKVRTIPKPIQMSMFKPMRPFVLKFPFGEDIVRHKKRDIAGSLLSGYKFRLFESKKYKYRSPFKI